jgi:hypothetical protein
VQPKKRLTPDEAIKRLDEKIEQLKHRKQAIANKEKERERKARTRRLIQIGALAEKYLFCEGIEPEDFERFIKEFTSFERNIKYLNSKNRHKDK